MKMTVKQSQRLRLNLTRSGEESESGESESGILDERILLLVFQSINWDPHLLCLTACVSRKLRAVAQRVLWRELCVSRAPRMIATVANGAPNGRFGGGWDSLAKLLFFCCGCEPSRHFRVDRSLKGHFVKASRFSKTSGQSFLTKKCQGDTLYVSDPCEHTVGGHDEDLGVYRGVFKGFVKSRTRACLIKRQAALEERIRCPYCGARVWSMTSAKLIPKGAARRLGCGSHEGRLEYFVCVNGHLHGTCWLARLSSDDEEEEEEEDEDGGVHSDYDDHHHLHRMVMGRSSSSGEEVAVEDGVAV